MIFSASMGLFASHTVQPLWRRKVATNARTSPSSSQTRIRAWLGLKADPEAQQIAHRLCRRVAETPVEGVAVTVSIGAAVSRPEEEEELEVTLQKAEAELYKAKKGGDDPVVG